MTERYTFELIKKIGTDIRYNNNNNNNNNILLCSDTDVPLQLGRLHNHDFYEIQYVFGGEGVEVLNNRSYKISAGSIVLLSPDALHSYYSTNNLSIVNVCFHPDKIQKRRLEFAQNVIFSLNENDRLEYEMIYYLLKNAIINDKIGERINNYFDLLLNIMCTFSFEKVHSDKKWSKLMVFISNNFNNTKLEEAAQICNFSVGYFSRQFKKDFGMTFIQYLDNLKIEKAKKMLLSGDRIEEISMKLGFSHQTRFYRKFKEIVGMTPKEYRNKGFREINK